ATSCGGHRDLRGDGTAPTLAAKDDFAMTTATAFSLARRLRAGETVHSGWCGLPSPIVAELVGREGFPAVTLAGQPRLWATASVLSPLPPVPQPAPAPTLRLP